MTARSSRVFVTFVLWLCLCPATRADQDDWYRLEVPGGRDTLRALGVPDSRERAAVMIDLIRRLHLSPKAPLELEAAVGQLRQVPRRVATPLLLPMPLSPAVWNQLVFRRAVPPERLFAEILGDERARLLFHGLAGLDPDTRRWLVGQPDLLRWFLASDQAARSFAWFAPALRIRANRLVIPGGELGVTRWSTTLGAGSHEPARFIRRLVEHNDGRTVGLYFLVAHVEPSRQQFVLGPRASDPRRFATLVRAFAACYPTQSTIYPFAVRSADAALLLLELELGNDGRPRGPTGLKFWQHVFAGDSFEDGDRPIDPNDTTAIDAAWMVETLCAAPARVRGPIFATLLAGPRVFGGVAGDVDDVAGALRSRRFFPVLFMAIEHVGVRQPRVFTAAAKRAASLGRIGAAEQAITATRIYQGALALTLNAVTSKVLSATEGGALVESLAATPLESDQYAGRIADWLHDRWLPAIRRADPQLHNEPSAERLVAAALSGSTHGSVPRVTWEGADYVVDHAFFNRRRLLDIRSRQGGVSLDQVLEMRAARNGGAPADVDRWERQMRSVVVADEYGGASIDLPSAVRDRRQRPWAVDVLLAHVLGSWAYAPHLGDPEGGSLVGGDGSLRHILGVRSAGRPRVELRWEPPSVAIRGRALSGSLLGLQMPLSPWSLRRLSSQAVPPPRTIDENDLLSLTLTASLSNPRDLTDGTADAIAAAIRRGSALVAGAGRDTDALDALAASAPLGPWRRAALPWMVNEEADRVAEQFSTTQLARLGGLAAGTDAWGTAAIATGCLCLRMPAARIPELVAGRHTDGIVSAQSADVMLQVTAILADLKVPASLASPVLAYAMRDYLDRVRPFHSVDTDAFARAARAIDRRSIEDYLGAVAAVGALRPVTVQ
jgi:hypothetical protein